jgi:hypothetical protein
VDVPEQRGVIDSVATGFQITNRHVRFLLIPVVLDLFLWLGPRISIEPLLNRVLGIGSSPIAEFSSTGAASTDQVATSVAGLNLMGLIAIAMPSSSQSVLGGPGGAGAALTIGTWPLAIAFTIVLLSVGLLVGTMFRSTVVQGVVRPSAWKTDDVFQTFVEAAPRYVRLLLLIAGIAMVGLGAGSVLVRMVDAVVPGAGGIILTVLTGFILWLLILFFLSESAVFVSGLGAVASLRASAQIVRAFLWPSVGLFLILRVIGFGTGIIWGRVGDASVMTLAAIGGNAYIATGLTVAAMVYYRDRMDVMRWNA